MLQLVSFFLGDEEYAIDVLKVQGIDRVSEITRVPRAPDFVQGVINLRGKIVPIIDLRSRIGLPPKEADRNSRVIVVDMGREVVGLRVDGVREVLRVPASVVEPPPDMTNAESNEFVEGMGKLEDRIILILNVDKILDSSERQALRNFTEDQS
ncbi:MAG TPA: chemotaxis protein CheW [Bacteroidetes bacterium]|nr:chemotaxis protein CheW [Bacteroidota bacterium]